MLGRSGIYLQYIKGLVMSSTFDQVATIIAETCDIPRDTITPESHAIDDLGIDSLDFLDIAFAIDKAFGIKLPLEKWTQEVNDGKATTEQYLVLENLSARLAELATAKGARPHRHGRGACPAAKYHLRRSFSGLPDNAGCAVDRGDGADVRLAVDRPDEIRAHAV